MNCLATAASAEFLSMRAYLQKLCDDAHDLATMRNAISALANSVHVPEDLLPAYDGSNREGPHIAFDGRKFIYLQQEQGVKYERLVTTDTAILIFRVLYDLTWEFAVRKELSDGIPGQDSRRLFFRYHLDLLGELDISWREIRQREIYSSLQERPFDDLSEDRFRLACELGKGGMSYEQAMEEARKKYPGT